MVVKRIVVVGGGSAGFLAAITLKARMPQLDVAVIRSKEIGIIGVGEGSTGILPAHLHGYLGIDQREFYAKADPIWKLGIRFLWGERPFFDYSFARQFNVHYPQLPRPNGYYCDRPGPIEYAGIGSALMQHNMAFARQQSGQPLMTAQIAYHLENKTFVGFLEEYALRVGVRIVEQVVQYLQNGIAINAVNMPALSPEQYRALGPYIALAEKLGAFATAISSGNPKSARLTYYGRIAELNTTLVRNAGLAGLLNKSLSHKANLVNALQLAADRGLSVTEVHQSKSATYTDSIRLELETNEGTVSVEGAVVLGNARLIRVNGIYCEAKLDGYLTFLVNQDLPGVIGFIGGVLGKGNVNIANFSLGRAEEAEKPGEPLTAVSVVETDAEVPDAVLAELLKNKAITLARVVELHN